MPLQETLDTFSYFISEADRLGLAYISLTRYMEALDPIFDGMFELNLAFLGQQHLFREAPWNSARRCGFVPPSR